MMSALQANGKELRDATQYHYSADCQIHETARGEKSACLGLDAQRRCVCAMACAPTQGLERVAYKMLEKSIID